MVLRGDMNMLIFLIVMVTIGSMFGAALLLCVLYRLLKYCSPRDKYEKNGKHERSPPQSIAGSEMPLMSVSGETWSKSSAESGSVHSRQTPSETYGSIQTGLSTVPDSPASLDTFQFESLVTDGSELVSPGEEVRFLNIPHADTRVGDIGSIEFSTRFTDGKGLTITVHSVNNLPVKETGASTDPYVRILLLKDDTRLHPEFEFQTPTKKDTESPIFEQSFTARGLSYPAVQEYYLKLIVCDYNKYFETDAIGEVKLPLDDIEPDQTRKETLSLVPSVVESKGDVLISLSYLPTSKRLLVTVLQARGLAMPDDVENVETFARIILFIGNRKIRRKKTMAAKTGTNVTFEERFYFDLPMEKLEKIKVMVVVTNGRDSGYDSESGVGGPEVEIGKVLIGRTIDSKAHAHWKEMLLHPRVQVAQWYTLKA